MVNFSDPIPILPFDILNLILQFDGRFKYSFKDRIFRSIISPLDERYVLLIPKIINKLYLIKNFSLYNNGKKYYIDFKYKNSEVGIVISKKILN